MDRLVKVVESSYQDMSSRIQRLECSTLKFFSSNDSVCEDDSASIMTVTKENFDPGSSAERTSKLSYSDFVADLEKSWVYKRNNAFRASGFSRSTASAYSTHWSIFSGISTAEVSNISIINLVISESETFNPKRDSQTWFNDRLDSV